MLEIITGGLSSLNAAVSLVKALNAATTQAQINEIKLDLQERISEARDALSSARESNYAALDRIRELEQKIAGFEDWEGEKERYHLVNIGSGNTAFMPKPGMENGEAPHWLCTKCFGDRQKGYLQMAQHVHQIGFGLHSKWECNRCGAEMMIGGALTPTYPV